VSGVFVTGSSDGIGLQTARALLAAGHRVVVHARDERRAQETLAAVPDAAGVAIGDVSTLAGMRQVAEQANVLGGYDAVVHNVGIGGGQRSAVRTEDGLERIFAVNVLAPYVLTCLMPLPHRLVYLTSGREAEGVADLADLQYERKPWNGSQAYSDSKLYDNMLAFAVARRFPAVRSNGVDPGWIRTRMGGPDAPDDLPEGAETQVWLATSDEPAALVTGRYLKRRQDLRANPAAYDEALQEGLLAACAEASGVKLPS
jgi:NAD(P)-dependent dehydrogenase (short-subunit alcohol dehydrogenase family)